MNTINKRLPFKKAFKYEAKTTSISIIKSQLKKMPMKTAVIDDFGYTMTAKFMSEHSTTKDGFGLYNQIADNVYDLIMFVKTELPEDVIVYFMFHEDASDNGETRLKTIGRLLTEKVCLEGMVTICLRSMKDPSGRYYFRTQSDGFDISKSPEGMFELEIENDLKFVDSTIREFWGL